jgi:hypothetical protein
MNEAVRHEHLVQFRVPTKLSEAIDEAARQKCQSRSEYLRQSLIERLRADGVQLANSALAETQYALVANGELVGGHTTFRPLPIADHGFAPGTIPDDAEWYPIENQDSEPFDSAQHWRLKPLPLRVDGDVVVREYPVIAKSQEHA